MSDRLKHFALLVCIVLLWECMCHFGFLPAIVLPAPSAIAIRLVALFTSGDIWPHLWATIAAVLSGFVLGTAFGLIFGMIVAVVPSVEKFAYPYIVAFQTVPKIAIAPLFLIWFGYGLMSKIVIAALVCFFPVLVSVMSAFHTTDRDQLAMMHAFGASRWQIFHELRVRAALPTIFTGLEVAAVFAVIGALVGEFVGSQEGLGYLISSFNYNLDVSGVFAVLIILSAIGMLLHLQVKLLGSRMIFWIRSGHSPIIGS